MSDDLQQTAASKHDLLVLSASLGIAVAHLTKAAKAIQSDDREYASKLIDETADLLTRFSENVVALNTGASYVQR